MGVITIAASFAMISGRKISLMQRSTMQEAISAPKVGGNRSLDRLYRQGDTGDGTAVCSRDGAGVLP